LAAAVFTLAMKLQPCIVFIDEIGKWMHFDKKIINIFQ
jgi:SpoVK/Ycf46/Vps4 family AAA+-type ATPase